MGAIATTDASKQQVRNHTSGQSLLSPRSLTQARKRVLLHARTSTKLTSCFIATRKRTSLAILCRLKTCIGHGAQVCSLPHLDLMTLALWLEPIGSRTLGLCASGALAAQFRKRSSKLPRLMSVQTV